MEFDYEFFKSIILIAIPTLGTTITSWIVTNRWQIRKEKLNIQRKNLDELDNSLGKLLHNMIFFTLKIWRSYTRVTQDTKEVGNRITDMLCEIPDDDDKKPSVKFANDADEFEQTNAELRFKLHEFVSTLETYYPDTNLIMDFDTFSEQLRKTHLLIEKILQSSNTEEFKKNNTDFFTQFTELQDNFFTFKTKLARSQIKKLNI